MKVFLASILLSGAIFALAGCESDLPATRHSAENQFERGITGKGQVFQPNLQESRVGY